MLKLCIWLQKGVWDSFTLFYFESEKLVRKLQNISAFEDISLIRKYHFILLKLSWFLNQCLFKINQSGTCITCKPVCFACFLCWLFLKIWVSSFMPLYLFICSFYMRFQLTLKVSSVSGLLYCLSFSKYSLILVNLLIHV